MSTPLSTTSKISKSSLIGIVILTFIVGYFLGNISPKFFAGAVTPTTSLSNAKKQIMDLRTLLHTPNDGGYFDLGKTEADVLMNMFSQPNTSSVRIYFGTTDGLKADITFFTSLDRSNVEFVSANNIVSAIRSTPPCPRYCDFSTTLIGSTPQ